MITQLFVKLLAIACWSSHFLTGSSAFTATPLLVARPEPRVRQGDRFNDKLNDLARDDVVARAKSCSCRFRNSVVLFMGWGPEPIWSLATVQSNRKACESERSVSIQVQVTSETSSQFTVPGQYVQVRLDEETKPLFLAMASPPLSLQGENNDSPALFEFLIKKTNSNDWMTELEPGAQLQVSQVLGKGFQITENLEGFKYDFPTQNILLFAAGSGLAPIKSALESGMLNVEPIPGGRSCRLYYGERTPHDLCYVEKFAQWEAAGYQVVPVLSQPDENSWQGRSGYVQNALEEDGVAIPRNSGALLCGMKGMTESVKNILSKAGVFEGRILFNF